MPKSLHKSTYKSRRKGEFEMCIALWRLGFLFVLGFISSILNSLLLLVFSNNTSVVVSIFRILAMSEAGNPAI